MKIKITLLILFLAIGNIKAQEILLKGKVTDSKTGGPLQGALIFISYNHMSYSSTDGAYTIKVMSEGSHNVKVSHIGYKSLSEDFNLKGSFIKDFMLDPSPIELDEVIVNSNRFENYLRNSPYSELLIGSSEIEQKPFQSLPDAIKTQPGISLISEGAWGAEISIRGLSRENVVALIDGNRIATSTDVAARFSLVNLDDIERVEIIKGASSSIYGSGATGGIINIVTKAPVFNEKLFLNGNFSTGFNSVNNMNVASGMLTEEEKFGLQKFRVPTERPGIFKLLSGKFKTASLKIIVLRVISI